MKPKTTLIIEIFARLTDDHFRWFSSDKHHRQKKRKHIKWKLVEREQSEILALSQHSMRINNTNSKFRSCAFAIISMDEYLIPPKRILFSAGDGEKKKRRRENVETKISIWILTTLTNFHPRYLSLKITVYINSHSPTQRRERATHNIKWTWWWWGHGKENPRFVWAFNSERDSRRSTFCPSSIRASRCFSFGVGKKITTTQPSSVIYIFTCLSSTSAWSMKRRREEQKKVLEKYQKIISFLYPSNSISFFLRQGSLSTGYIK